MASVSAGGVHISVALDAGNVIAEAATIAAGVNRAFAQTGAGIAASQALAAQFTATGNAGVAAATAATKANRNLELQIDRTSAAAANAAATGKMSPEVLGASNMAALIRTRVAVDEADRRSAILTAEVRSKAATAEITTAWEVSEEKRKALAASEKAAEEAAKREAERQAASRNAFRSRQIGPEFTAMMQAGFTGAQAAQAQMAADRKRLADSTAQNTTRIIAERDRNIASARREASEIQKFNQQMTESLQAPKKAAGGAGGGDLLGGLSHLAFGLSLAKSGSAISGAALAASGLRTALVGVTSVSAGAATGIGLVVAAVISMVGVVSKATTALTDFIGSILKSAEALETQAVSFEVLTGSAGAARQEFDSLAKMAFESPFDLKDIVEIDKYLLSVNIGSNQLRRDLTQSITDIGSAFGFGADRMQLIAFAMAQVSAAGKVTGDEVRQLRNQMIPMVEVLKELPKYAGMSSAAIKELIEAGKVSSTEGIQALVLWSKEFENAAKRQSLTVRGLLTNLKEVFTTRAGAAFGPETFGGIDVLKPIRDALLDIMTVVKDMNWVPLASAVKNVFNAIGSGVGGTRDVLNSLKNFFESTLPNAINATAALIGPLIGQLKILGAAFLAMAPSAAINDATNSTQNLAATLNMALIPLKLFTSEWLIAMNAIGAAMDAVYGIASAVFHGIKMLMNSVMTAILSVVKFGLDRIVKIPLADRLMKEVFGFNKSDVDKWAKDSRVAFTNASDAMEDDISGIGKAVTKRGIETENRLKTMWGAWAKIPKLATSGPQAVKPSWFEDWLGERSLIDQDIAKIQEEQKKEDEENAKKIADAAKAAADRRRDLMIQVAEMTKSWFGQRSEFMKGLLGDEGFTASADQIANTAKRMSELMEQLGRKDLVRQLAVQTKQLLDLAHQRDAIAEKLKEAEEKLRDAVKARDEMIRQVRDSSIAFVNQFKQEEEKFTEVVGTATGWIVVERTRTKGFVQGLRDRLTALKKFIGQIRGLSARGLDADLLQQLIEAGPEAAGTVVDELALSSDEVLKEVNTLQSDLKQSAGQYGTEVGDKFHKAGIDIIQASIDGMKSKQAELAFQAFAIFLTMQQAIQPIADAGEVAGKAFAQNLINGVAEGLTHTARMLSKFQLEYIQKQKEVAFAEGIRANLQDELNKVRARVAITPQQSFWKTLDAKRLENRIAEIDEGLRRIWQPWVNTNIQAQNILPFGQTDVNVYIGNEKIANIAKLEVQNENDVQMQSATSGWRSGV